MAEVKLIFMSLVRPKVTKNIAVDGKTAIVNEALSTRKAENSARHKGIPVLLLTYPAKFYVEQDRVVEVLTSTALPMPHLAKHVQGGRPLSEPMLTPHSPQTNNG
jgi:hypothetical protein